MEQHIYDSNEIIALIVNTVMGLAAYIGFQINIQKVSVKPKVVFWAFCIALFLSHVTTQLLFYTEYYHFRSFIVPLVSAFSTFIIKMIVTFFEKDARAVLVFLLETLIGRLRRNNDYGGGGIDYDRFKNDEEYDEDTEEGEENNTY